jgi:NSS family neurotransmitter:Na+ symporter
MPLLMLETAIGRKTHKSAPLALKALDKKAEPLGWSAIGNAFFVTTYYAVVF